MSGTIWLITEDENDGEVIKALLAAKNIHVRVKIRKLTGNTGSVSRLAVQLKKHIQTAQREKSANDCIAVLHDADEKSQPDRELYRKIAQICRQMQVKEVIAKDELESWLLADGGLCKWLGITPKNWDEQRKPSDKLASLLKAKKKLKYQARGRDVVRNHLDGTGDKYSHSMSAALKLLEDAPCIKD